MQPRPLVSPSRPRFEPNGRPWGMFAGLASFTAGAAGVISQSAEAMEFASPLSLYQRIPGKACISPLWLDELLDSAGEPASERLGDNLVEAIA
jgi:hypothetical protein